MHEARSKQAMGTPRMSDSAIIHHLVALQAKLAEDGETLGDLRDRLGLLVRQFGSLTHRVGEIDERLAGVERRVDQIDRSLSGWIGRGQTQTP